MAKDRVRVRTVEDGMATVHAHLVLENLLALSAVCIL